jgi:hypothetical protein
LLVYDSRSLDRSNTAIAPNTAAGMAAVEDHRDMIGFNGTGQQEQRCPHDVIDFVAPGIATSVGHNQRAVFAAKRFDRVGVNDGGAMAGVVEDDGVPWFGLFDQVFFKGGEEILTGRFLGAVVIQDEDVFGVEAVAMDEQLVLQLHIHEAAAQGVDALGILVDADKEGEFAAFGLGEDAAVAIADVQKFGLAQAESGKGGACKLEELAAIEGGHGG